MRGAGRASGCFSDLPWLWRVCKRREVEGSVESRTPACVECLLQGAVEGSLQQGVASLPTQKPPDTVAMPKLSLHSKLLKLVFLFDSAPREKSIRSSNCSAPEASCRTSLGQDNFTNSAHPIIRPLTYTKLRFFWCRPSFKAFSRLPLMEARSKASRAWQGRRV